MFDLYFFLGLLVLGLITGTLIEKRHYRKIREREANLMYLPTIDLRRPLNEEEIKASKLITGNVVISIDFFKKFLRD